jgi:hypothetical protein
MGKTKYESVDTGKVYNNTTQNLIRITEDKLEKILMNYISNVRKKGDWKAPLGILISIVLALISTQFQDALFLEAAVWKAIFIVSLFLSIGWFAYKVYYCLRIDSSLKTLMDKIKNVN